MQRASVWGAGVAGGPLPRGRCAALQPPGGRLRRPAALQCAPSGLLCEAPVTWLSAPVLHTQDINCICMHFLAFHASVPTCSQTLQAIRFQSKHMLSPLLYVELNAQIPMHCMRA